MIHIQVAPELPDAVMIVARVRQDHRGYKEIREYKVYKVYKECRECKECVVVREIQVPKDWLAILVLLVIKVRWVIQGVLVIKVIQVLLVLKD